MSRFFQANEKANQERALNQRQHYYVLDQHSKISEPPSFYFQQRGGGLADEYVYSVEEQDPGLREYWKIVWKHRRLVIGAFLVVLALGAWWTFSRTPLFTAAAILKIEPRTPTIMQPEERMAQAKEEAGPYDYYKTQFALLESRPLAARVISELQLINNPAFSEMRTPGILTQWVSSLSENVGAVFSYLYSFFSSSSPPPSVSSSSNEFTFGIHPRFITHYLNLLHVKPIDGTRLVEVRFTTPDPVLSQQLANAHASTFIQTTLETRFDLTKEARDFLEKKLSELKARVQNAEEALNTFRQTRGVVSLEGNENIVVERMVDLNRRLTEATAKRIEMESLFRMTEKKDARYLSQIIESPLIQQLKTSMASQEAEQARFAVTYTPAHPRLVELRQQLAQSRRRLEGEIASVVRKIESDYSNARAKEATLQEEAQRQQQAALKFKELGAEYTFLKEEADSSRALYERVLKRLHETSIANEGAVSNIEVSEPADMPLAPSSPKVGRDLLLLGLGGMLLGVGLAVFRQYTDSTVGTPEDVWRVASSPTLGVIPSHTSIRRWPYVTSPLPPFASGRRFPGRSKVTNGVHSQELVTAHHPLSIFAECYRNLCARLLFSHDEHAPRVILLTSAHPGDGKTVTTLNLAITLAQSGRRVAVVDADIRRGRCHTLLHKDNSSGLSAVLAGTVPLQQALQDTSVPGLALLSRGVANPSSPFSLASPQMKELIKTLREQFEFVLIDSPPAIVVSDAILLSQWCDGVLLVIHGQQTTEESARRLVKELESVRAPILGAVLTSVNFDSPDYAEYRRYAESTDGTVTPDPSARTHTRAAERSIQP